MPRKLIASLEDHAARDALIFLDIGFFEVGAAVFARQFGFLARHLARYSAKFSGMSDAEIIDMLKERLKPVRM